MTTMTTKNQLCNYFIAIPNPTNPAHVEYIPLTYVDQVSLLQAVQTQTYYSQLQQYQLNVQQQQRQQQLEQQQQLQYVQQLQQLQQPQQVYLPNNIQPQATTTACYPYAPATIHHNTVNTQQNTHLIQQQYVQTAQNRTAFDASLLSLDSNLQSISEEKESKFPTHEISPVPSTASNAPSTPSFSPISSVSPSPPTTKSKRVKGKKPFRAKYPHRAQLNVFIPLQITKGLLDIILEQFPTPQSLYYYMDISTALQLNDAQMFRFEIDGEEIVFVNYDLHTKDTRDPIYGVIGVNDQHNSKKDKWCWRLFAFQTAQQIYQEYGVCHNELPLSSRRMNYFVKQFETQRNPVIDAKIIDTTDWSDVRQIKARRKKDKMRRYSPNMDIVMRVDRHFFIRKCKESWDSAPVIPIVVKDSKCNQHWIEWVKLIRFRDNERIGISCKYNTDYNEWRITSICLDKGDLENKHRLLGLTSEADKKVGVSYLEKFNTTFTEIQWIKSYNSYYY